MNPIDDLAAAWRADNATVDSDALVDAARRGRRRLRWRFALELVASAAVVAFWLPWISSGGTGALLLGGGSIAFVVVWCTLLWRNQRGTWVEAVATVDGFRALQRRRLQAALRWTFILRRFLVALAGLFIIAAPFVLNEGWAIYSREPWRFVVGTAGFFAILAGLWVHAGRQRTRHMHALDAFSSTDDEHPT